MWSSCTKRSATIRGWWYGRLSTPEASFSRFVRCAAATMNSSGEAIVSHPAVWCSPIQASSKSKRSICSSSSRSRSNAIVGFSSSRWNGPMKMPNFMRGGR